MIEGAIVIGGAAGSKMQDSMISAELIINSFAADDHTLGVVNQSEHVEYLGFIVFHSIDH